MRTLTLKKVHFQRIFDPKFRKKNHSKGRLFNRSLSLAGSNVYRLGFTNDLIDGGEPRAKTVFILKRDLASLYVDWV